MIALPLYADNHTQPTVLQSRLPDDWSHLQPWYRLLAGDPPLVFLVDGSQIYQIDQDMYAALTHRDARAEAELRTLAERGRQASNLHDVVLPSAPSALTLNLAQACNLACGYCYADEGRFGQTARMMSRDVAFRAIDRLMETAPGRRVTLGFMGGEPFLNRPILHASVWYARHRAAQRGLEVAFSVTTNGTLLGAADIALLRQHAFCVSVSLDGGAAIHDRQRPRHNGTGSHAQVIARLLPLLRDQGAARVVARCTITRLNLQVAERLQALAEYGFTEVGVSSVRVSRDPTLMLQGDDWARFLEAMIHAADVDLRRVRAGDGPPHLRLSNLAIALKQLHRGSARALPCGAALSYVSVSAEGHYYTCHRTIDTASFWLGDGESGPSAAARQQFVAARLVDAQEPCRACWARYLCGGGCHAEVASAGRTGCDYIRGWLTYCIRTYDQLLAEYPHLLGSIAKEEL